jgi:CDP-glycerol glycerophosphotransferase
MKLRLLSGNLTISSLTKQFKDTWSLKIKNNLTKDGIKFDITTIDNFKLVVGKNADNIISSYSFVEDGFINAEMNLNTLSKFTKVNDITEIYAVLDMGEHQESVEVLAWNGTIISHVYNQVGNKRIGIGRNSNNLFLAWQYDADIRLNNVFMNDDILSLDVDSDSDSTLYFKDIDNNLYDVIYSEYLGRYTFNLNEFDLSKGHEFVLQNINNDSQFFVNDSILNNEYLWNNKGIQFDYNNLGQLRLRILPAFALISKVKQDSKVISMDLEVPLRALNITHWNSEDKLTFEVVALRNQTPIFIKTVDKFETNHKKISLNLKIQFSELIPYGENQIYIRVLDKGLSVIKTIPIYLGNQRNNFSINSSFQGFSLVEIPTIVNFPVKLSRCDGTFNLNEINKYTDNIINSRLKKQTIEYVTYRENLPIEKDVIVYESFFGALSDNPLALFKYIYNKDVEKKYIHVWVVSNPNLQDLLSDYDSSNIIFVKYNSNEYLRWMAIAQNIVFNTSTSFPFATRKGQHVLQTWHGVPLKTLGRDMGQAKGLNRNVIRSMSQATLFTNPNVYTESKVLDSLDFADIQKGQRMVVSYPRQQRIIIAKNENFKSYLSTKMPINLNKKIALYAPTWRGSNGNYKDVAQEYTDAINLINKYLPNDYQLLFKPHKNATNFFKDNNSIVIIPDWIDVNEVMSVTDLLISDYSSIVFDFYFTGKPVINWMYDKDDYAKNNGFYSEIFTELVWPTNNEKKLGWMLSNLDKYPKIKEPFIDVKEHDIQDIVDTWLDNNSVKENTQLKNVKLYIVYASDVRQHKTQLINKINKLDKSMNDTVIALLHIDDYTKKEDDFFDALSADVRNFYRVGQPDISVTEYIAMKKLEYGKNISYEDQKAVHEFADRELQREVGNLKIVQVEPLGIIRDDDWASRALVEFSLHKCF